MTAVCRLICLANSRKRSGRCVAGKTKHPDGSWGWVRPVSDRPDGEVSFQERRIAGREPALLDILDIPLREPTPHGYQTENWTLDARQKWTYVGAAAWRHLAPLADHPTRLWANGWHTPHGKNDRVPLDDTGLFTESLYLVRVDRVSLRILVQPNDPLKRVQAIFEMNGEEYVIRVTDPVIEQAYLVFGNRSVDLGESFLTVSLGEPWAGYGYKLVAGIVTTPEQPA